MSFTSDFANFLTDTVIVYKGTENATGKFTVISSGELSCRVDGTTKRFTSVNGGEVFASIVVYAPVPSEQGVMSMDDLQAPKKYKFLIPDRQITAVYPLAVEPIKDLPALQMGTNNNSIHHFEIYL